MTFLFISILLLALVVSFVLLVNNIKRNEKNESLVKDYKKFCKEKRQMEIFLDDSLEDYLSYLNTINDNLDTTKFESTYSLYDNTDYEHNRIYFTAEIYIYFKDKKRKSYISEVHRIAINHPLDDYGVLGNFILNEYDLDNKVKFKTSDSFKNFLINNYSQDALERFEIIEEDVFKTPFSVKEICKQIKLEERTALKEKADDFKEDITSKIFDIKRISEGIDDIDISISVSELVENTDVLLEMLSRMRSINKINESYTSYNDSLVKILSLLNKFKSLKDSDSLPISEEESIQTDIDVEISKCSKIVKFK